MARHKGRKKRSHKHTSRCNHTSEEQDDFLDEEDDEGDDENEDDEDEDGGYDDYDEEIDWDTPLIPIINESPKIGRNDRCPCGSKKKYKKCCLK